MAPRRRRTAASGLQQQAPGLKLNDLGDALLVQIFGGLSQRERLGMAALVCRRWAELVCSPQLLAGIRTEARLGFTSTSREALLRRADSFTAFLERRAAGHVRRLRISLDLRLTLDGGHVGEFDVETDTTEEDRRTLQSAYMGAAALCGAGLEELDLTLESELHWRLPAALPAALPRLRRLTLLAGHGPRDAAALTIDCSMAAMTALEELRLESPDAVLVAGAVLPDSLTRLRLPVADLPPQVGALTRLKKLQLLWGRDYGAPDAAEGEQEQAGPDDGTLPPGFTALSLLGGRLERLDLTELTGLPGSATLAALTRLHTLHARLEGYANVDGSVAALGAALPALSGLTTLCLAWRKGEQCQQPQALGALSRGLQACINLRRLQLSETALPPASAAGWWGHLQRLSVSADCLVDCSDALAGATQLEWLGICPPISRPGLTRKALKAALQLPSMQGLSMDGYQLEELESFAGKAAASAGVDATLCVRARGKMSIVGRNPWRDQAGRILPSWGCEEAGLLRYWFLDDY